MAVPERYKKKYKSTCCNTLAKITLYLTKYQQKNLKKFEIQYILIPNFLSIMSSTILYKFRSGTTFEALSLPGNNARLLDIKKAIVTAKKLDQGSMDFDLSVKDATSGIEYMDDTAILPRGTRIVVQRLPSARGQGILSKIARSQFGDKAPFAHQNDVGQSDQNTDFYTIDSRDREEDEEFVSSSVIPPPPPSPLVEDTELAALRAVTDTSLSGGGRGIGRGAGGTILRGGPGGGFRPNQPAGLGPPPPRGLEQHLKPVSRPNADPEIRELEQQPQKKRATGIPRTFLSLSAPQGADGLDGGAGGNPIIQPNTFVFEELLTRGGGQSENAAGTKRDLDYALKITATTIPEYLQCAICHNVVRDAMMLPWDPEGRTTCEQCIRTALTENGFRCPLTQQEGVSPDDLLPNHALRKAAAQFVKDVMEKMKEIDQQADMEEEINVENDKQNLLEGDINDKGVVITRRTAASEKRKKDDDEFDDDFGGDVFAVEADKPGDHDVEDVMSTEAEAISTIPPNDTMDVEPEPNAEVSNEQHEPTVTSDNGEETKRDEPASAANLSDPAPAPVEPVMVSNVHNVQNRRVTNRRGPPVGYTMGPASVTINNTTPHDPNTDTSNQVVPNNVPQRAPYRGGGGRRGGGAPNFYRGNRNGGIRYNTHIGGGNDEHGHHNNQSHDDVRILVR
jgi:hypothetical protein